MKKLKKFLTTVIVLFTGATCSSLWITHNGNWEIYLPIILISISIILASENYDRN